ncbi:glycosyltransferase, partial [Enterobacter roggenkampii]|uniref:glycosyltransferase n=2 Tax=Pseudomonadota TaxID=1224 RepID=UPI003BEF47B3
LTGGTRADAVLAEIEPRLKLGVHRVAIRREPRFADLMVWAHIAGLIRKLKPDVVHGHGAKAGAYVRLRRRSNKVIRV